MRDLYYDLLRMSAVSLGLEEDWFVSRALRAPHTFNINRYPPLTVTGAALDGQFRVAQHTDWGILTILDRQPADRRGQGLRASRRGRVAARARGRGDRGGHGLTRWSSLPEAVPCRRP